MGQADNKNPPGQHSNGSDGNAGYECDRNQGIGQTNPAHTGCTHTVSPPACTQSSSNNDCGNSGPPACSPNSSNNDCGNSGPPACSPNSSNNNCGNSGPPACSPNSSNNNCGNSGPPACSADAPCISGDSGSCTPTVANHDCHATDSPTCPAGAMATAASCSTSAVLIPKLAANHSAAAVSTVKPAVAAASGGSGGSGGILAFTGADIVGESLGGLAVVGAGALMVGVASRRRRRRQDNSTN